MTVSEIKTALGLKTFARGEDKEITSGYCGDLLSRVLCGAPEGCAWITIMNNANVAAVALMCGAACVILAEGVSPDGELAKRARDEEILLLGSDEGAFSLAARLSGLIKTS